MERAKKKKRFQDFENKKQEMAEASAPSTVNSTPTSGPGDGKVVKYVNPIYNIKSPSYVDTSTIGAKKTFNKPVDFQVPAVWGSQQQVTFNITTQRLDMNYAEAELNMNLQITSTPGSNTMTAYPAGTPIAFAPDLAATLCDSFNWGLSTGGTIENPPGGQSDGIFIGDMVEFSNDWLIGQQGQQDAFILDDPGETQDTTGQSNMSSNNLVPAVPVIINTTQTLKPQYSLNIFGTPVAGTLGLLLLPASAGQTHANTNAISLTFTTGTVTWTVFAVSASGIQSTGFTIVDVTGTQGSLQLTGSGAYASAELLTFYAVSTAGQVVTLTFLDSSQAIPVPMVAHTVAATNATTTVTFTAVGTGSLSALDTVTVSGINQVVTANTSRGFWKRQALTDAGTVWSASIKIKRIISFLRSYRKVINAGNFFLQLTMTANQVANMLQRSAWVTPGGVWVSDMQLTLTQLNPSIAAERRLELKVGDRIDFNWIRRRTVKITPIQSGSPSYEVSFNVLGEFIEFMIFTFKPTTYFGNQVNNSQGSFVPAPTATPPAVPAPNPINQAFIQMNGGDQIPASSYGQFPSDLGKQFAEVLNLEARTNEELLSGPINISNYLKNYFFFVFNLRNRPQVDNFNNNQQNQVQTQFTFATAFNAQYDVRVTTFSRANGRWEMVETGEVIYTPRGFRDVGTG